ncbi:MAG: hypothetical protein GF311_26295 [Candidatus Lokiarchaeota archaeon]|nr:hypothetical protein [Candidatus Lokiarchaeota archaeon]
MKKRKLKSLRRIGDINSKQFKLSLLKDKSICFCAYCRRSDLDMQFNAQRKEWICKFCNKIFFKEKEYYDNKFNRMNFQQLQKNLWGKMFDPNRK